jgi:hypothetical protein
LASAKPVRLSPDIFPGQAHFRWQAVDSQWSVRNIRNPEALRNNLKRKKETSLENLKEEGR